MILGDVVPFAGIRQQVEETRTGLIAPVVGLVGFGSQEVDERALRLLTFTRGADARDEFPAGVTDGEHIALRTGDERLAT